MQFVVIIAALLELLNKLFPSHLEKAISDIESRRIDRLKRLNDKLQDDDSSQ